MKIGVKLLIVIVALSVAGIGVLVTTTTYTARTEITALTGDDATNIAKESSRSVQAWLNVYMDTVRTLASIMAHYEEIDVSLRRDYYTQMVRSVAVENPGLLSAWTGWEPNVLDGRDAEFVNTPGSDSSGRFIPYLIRKDGQNVSLECLTEYNDETVLGGYYLKSLRSGKEAVIEPYIWKEGGQSWLLDRKSVV